MLDEQDLPPHFLREVEILKGLVEQCSDEEIRGIANAHRRALPAVPRHDLYGEEPPYPASVTGKGVRIRTAVHALLESGVPLQELKPGELRARISAWLRSQGMLQQEIPAAITFKRYFRNYPLKAHVAAWNAKKTRTRTLS